MASTSPASMPWIRTRVPTSTPPMSANLARTANAERSNPDRLPAANRPTSPKLRAAKMMRPRSIVCSRVSWRDTRRLQKGLRQGAPAPFVRLYASEGVLLQKLAHRGHSMVTRPGKHGLAQGYRFEVIAAADFRLRAVFQSTQELGHRANEGIREPSFLPVRLQPVPRLLFGAERERAGSLGGVAWPADRAACEAVGPFDAPADEDVAFGASRQGPDQTSSQLLARQPDSYSRM